MENNFWRQLNRYRNDPIEYAKAFWEYGNLSNAEKINFFANKYSGNMLNYDKTSIYIFMGIYDFASEENKVNIINKFRENRNITALTGLQVFEAKNEKYGFLDLIFVPFRHINRILGVLGCVLVTIDIKENKLPSLSNLFSTFVINAASAYGYYRSIKLYAAEKRGNMIKNGIDELNRECKNSNNRNRENIFLGDNGRTFRAMETHRQMNQGENQHNQNQINQPLLNI